MSILIFVSGVLPGQELNHADFFRNLNDTINNFDFANYKPGSDGLLFLPSVYLSKKWETYASFGIMINNPFYERPHFENDELDENRVTTVFKAAILVHHRKTNLMLYVDYYSDYSWGLSFRLKY
ncbi:MAG: hypothetical protein LBH44_11110 [Treponema sp.]|nr:hypothetical protein [Treponema sp.]